VDGWLLVAPAHDDSIKRRGRAKLPRLARQHSKCPAWGRRAGEFQAVVVRAEWERGHLYSDSRHRSASKSPSLYPVHPQPRRRNQGRALHHARNTRPRPTAPSAWHTGLQRGCGMQAGVVSISRWLKPRSSENGNLRAECKCRRASAAGTGPRDDKPSGESDAIPLCR
jgi:hypothetical protein